VQLKFLSANKRKKKPKKKQKQMSRDKARPYFALKAFSASGVPGVLNDLLRALFSSV